MPDAGTGETVAGDTMTVAHNRFPARRTPRHRRWIGALTLMAAWFVIGAMVGTMLCEFGL